MLGRICGAAIALGLFGAPALGQIIEGVYTTFDAKKCRHTKGVEVEDYGAWQCAGHAGLQVHLSAGDQRMFVSYGPWKDSLAAAQTLPGFNDVYEGTVEWRIEKNAHGRPRPFATILRWNVMMPQDRDKATATKASGRVLVVTRLGPGGSCHVGYVDARANPDANALARKLADEHARTFKCGTDKLIVAGTKGSVDMPRDEN
jgi:hypothetical protein